MQLSIDHCTRMLSCIPWNCALSSPNSSFQVFQAGSSSAGRCRAQRHWRRILSVTVAGEYQPMMSKVRASDEATCLLVGTVMLSTGGVMMCSESVAVFQCSPNVLGQSTGKMESVDWSASRRASGIDAITLDELDIHFLRDIQARENTSTNSAEIEIASSVVSTLRRQSST